MVQLYSGIFLAFAFLVLELSVDMSNPRVGNRSLLMIVIFTSMI